MRRDIDIEKLIKKRLEEYSKELGHNYRVDVQTFRLSSSSVCPRKLYYLKRYPPRYNGDSSRIFLIGQIFHELIQRVVFDNCKWEVEVVDNYRDITIMGHCDVLTDSSVYELKTCSVLPERPYINHVLQANAYAVLLDRDEYSIVYMQKNRLNIRAFRLPTDRALYNKLCETFYTAYRGVVEDRLPNRIRSSECKFCGYKLLCSKDIR